MNYAVSFRGPETDRWHRWTVCSDPVDALYVLDYLLDTKGVAGAAVDHTTDDAAPHWRTP